MTQPQPQPAQINAAQRGLKMQTWDRAPGSVSQGAASPHLWQALRFLLSLWP